MQRDQVTSRTESDDLPSSVWQDLPELDDTFREHKEVAAHFALFGCDLAAGGCDESDQALKLPPAGPIEDRVEKRKGNRRGLRPVEAAR